MSDSLDDKIVAWITAQARPVLWSEITEAFGRWAPTHEAFERLQRAGSVGAVFPESKPGDSGRQHWVIMP